MSASSVSGTSILFKPGNHQCLTLLPLGHVLNESFILLCCYYPKSNRHWSGSLQLTFSLYFCHITMNPASVLYIDDF